MINVKKIVAAAVAAATFSAMSVTASAYSDSASWSLYTNAYVSRPTQDFFMNYYSAGYRAVITDKDYGGAYNYVTITEKDIQKAMLTEIDQPCKIFKATYLLKDNNGDFYAAFKAEMFVEDGTSKTPCNYGDIRLSNMF